MDGATFSDFLSYFLATDLVVRLSPFSDRILEKLVVSLMEYSPLLSGFRSRKIPGFKENIDFPDKTADHAGLLVSRSSKVSLTTDIGVDEDFFVDGAPAA